MNNSLEHLQKISPDLKNVRVVTEPVDYDGWQVHLCYSTGKCADFGVDRADVDEWDMHKLILKAIIKQLKYHESIKDKA